MFTKTASVAALATIASAMTLEKSTPTHAGNAPHGSECHFPFKYHGKTYDSCTDDGWSKGVMWCYVKTKSGGLSSKWGECPDSTGIPGKVYKESEKAEPHHAAYKHHGEEHEAIGIYRGRKLAVVDTTSEYTLDFDIKPYGTIGGWSSVLQMEDPKVGSKTKRSAVPGVFMESHGTKMQVMSSQAHRSPQCSTCAKLPMNEWSKVTIQVKGEFLTVAVNDKQCCKSKLNKYGADQKLPPAPMDLWAGNTYHNPSKASLREISYNGKHIAGWDKKPEEHEGADFGSLSFLDDVDSFDEAQAARDRYVAEQERLDKERTKKAHEYFGAMRRAMAAAGAKAEFDDALEGKIAEHEAAIAAHDLARTQHEEAQADTGHRQGVLVAAAEARRLTGIRKTQAQDAVAEAEDDVARAKSDLADAHNSLGDAEAEEKQAIEVDTAAHKAEDFARKAHNAATIKEAAAKDKREEALIAEQDAREAEIDARRKKEAGDEAHRLAQEAKSDAYAVAVSAHRAKIAHQNANTQHHL